MQTFSFNEQNLEIAEKILLKYPKQRKQSAIMPLLDLAQRQNGGWLSRQALEYVANYLDMTHVKVYEIASFYTMFNLSPVGQYHIQVCRTTPCWLNGAKETLEKFENILNIKCGQTTQDGMFTLSEVECLGACTKAPAIQINDQYYENVCEPEKIINKLKK